MRYYAIADLHGRFDLLASAVVEIESHSEGHDYKVITLGDYIDRGPDSKHIIDYLMIQDDNFICLQGNHEKMMYETITTPIEYDWWVDNGGDATLRSYGWEGPPYSQYAYEVVNKAHLEWIEKLPLHYETEKQVFVHAGIPQWNMNLPPSSKQAHKKKQLEEQMQWMLYNSKETGGWKGKHVVHGHHQFASGPHTWHGPKGGRTNLDTFAWKTGRLVVGVFDDSQGHPIDFIEVTDGST